MGIPVWGAANIGPPLGLTAKQIYYLADKGLVPAIRKVGRRLVADIDKAREQLVGTALDEIGGAERE